MKISGMIDESMDTEQMKQPAKPWEFRSKPAWQRLLIMVGGVLMNFLLAIFIYSMILFHWGDSFVSLQDMTHGMKFNERAREIGFRDGDILLRADEKPLERFGVDMLRDIAEARTVTVLRDGKEAEVYMPEISLLDIAKDDPMFVTALVPNVVDSVIPGGGLDKAGIQKGDSLIAVNGEMLNSWNALVENWIICRLMRKLPERRELPCKWFILVADCVIRLPCIRTHCLEWGQRIFHWPIIKKLPVNMDSLNLFLQGYN